MIRDWLLFTCVFGAISFAHAEPVSCMVLGDKSARIKSVEGEKSPIFMTEDCQALRLVSGKATASWIGKDGKPRMIPITASGVESVPEAGAEERSSKVVWAELTTRREAQVPAYMRNVGAERPPAIYVPREKLVLIARLENRAEVTVLAQSGESVYSASIEPGNEVALTRGNLANDGIYEVRIRQLESLQSWRWKMVSEVDARKLDSAFDLIEEVSSNPADRAVLRAMLFDQFKLRTNMDLQLQAMKSGS